SDLSRLVAETPIGKIVTVRLQRKGVQQEATVKVAETPGEPVASSGRAQTRTDLGMSVDNILEKHQRQFQLRDRTGIVVVSVAPGGRAEQAGIQAGDIIKELNRFSVRNLDDYRTILRQVKSGASLQRCTLLSHRRLKIVALRTFDIWQLFGIWCLEFEISGAR
ncbi:MAG: PDZ domain-containing protein, partial [Syntrophales bacterium LBB04]|nr:PDZ domain-containing protein [Syntrophales bacterium LBB04]